jgi:hypothetical protein
MNRKNGKLWVVATFPVVAMALLIATTFPWLTQALADNPEDDYTQARLEDFGLSPIKPIKDPVTGFTVGGANPTTLIPALTEINGQGITKLEETMRPGAISDVSSTAGFLGPEERLLEVLSADNRYVVDELQLTHQELARHLRLVAAIASRRLNENKAQAPFRYHGRRYNVDLKFSRGYQESPFRDGDKSNTDVTVTNLDNEKSIQYSLLVPSMIERYGFYEGQGTPYRVDPRRVVAVFDFLKGDSTPR